MTRRMKSSIKFYAREQQMSETRRQLSRIDKRIKACKREQIEMEEGAKPKRRRKMNHPVKEQTKLDLKQPKPKPKTST